MSQGLEKPKRLEEYMSAFEKELKTHKKDIIFSWMPDKSEKSYASMFTEKRTKVTTSVNLRTRSQARPQH